MQWTQKETDLLKDLKGQEQLCVDKYTRHAEAAADPQLKNLFSQLAQNEQQHRHAPDKIIDPAVDRFQNRHNLLHKNPPRQIFLYHTTFFPDVKENLLLAFFVEI